MGTRILHHYFHTNDGEAYLTDLCTMMQVVLVQTKYLEDLRKIFQTSYELGFNDRPQWNEFEIPFMDNLPEQIQGAMKSIARLITHRGEFHKELKNLGKELELLRTLVGPVNTVFSGRMGYFNAMVVPAP